MPLPQRSKPVNVGLWILSLLAAALFITAGGYKLADRMHVQFAEWGFPPGFDASVGILEILGACGLMFKRTAGWSAIGLMVIMLGAIWTHLSHGEMLPALLPTGVLVILGLIAWGRGAPIHTKQSRQLTATPLSTPPEPSTTASPSISPSTT